jgi:hypothetical protein
VEKITPSVYGEVKYIAHPADVHPFHFRSPPFREGGVRSTMDNFIDVARKPQEIIFVEIKAGALERAFDNFQMPAMLGRHPETVEHLIDALSGS